MNKQEQRIAIAKSLGWTKIGIDGGEAWGMEPEPITEQDENGTWVPDYLNDLNAMHEAEKFLSDSDKSAYWHQLNEQVQGTLNIAFATAAQRAEAFLKTLNLWTK